MPVAQARCLANTRLITFDLFDTLYRPKQPIGRTYAQPLWDHGLDVAEHAVAQSFIKSFKHTHAEYPNYGKAAQLTSSQWWHLVIRRTWTNAGVDLQSHPLLVQKIPSVIQHFATGAGYTMFPEVPKVLKYIRRKGIKMGVVSNMDESAEMILKCLGIREYFDFVLKSITVGMEKPDPRIFEMALAAVNVPAYDALHVGDSVIYDFEPARKCGMEALVVCRDDKGKLQADPRYIRDLECIAKML
ncbi:Haloacid dehalogenase-like hydrolase domain-containing protein 3 [Coemansia sp. RSA 2599]|nr:Haloacid dehalogenase-like hydrolase domain-containing protein 3 [Coemansia sp. RSA 2598]KAJ1828954.1 Haloacid dehalogenase-like hydrolase domain-containing protein 3 [Coemansia sp. RSA 2599]